MAIFIGTFENKVDQKGRVSVPAQFRQALAGQAFNGIAAFRSHRADAVEACGMDFMEQMIARASEIDLFSETHDDLATTIFSDSQQLGFDSTGRIMLPDSFRTHAGIADRAAFVGMGQLFQIWEPEKLEAHKAAARQRARQQRLTLPAPGNSGGGGR
ncbi:MAG: division/cell wall cluster transcriptional repressor MraZ [Kiloniellaceae bacterium]|nr:division/cell wall cluster transcriptional repressor MraZ [Kiloniellaceae bacterium]